MTKSSGIESSGIGSGRTQSGETPAGTMRSSGAGSSGLTDRHRAMLELERYAPVLASPKSEHIRTIFRLSPRRYHQLLDVLIDQPAALQYDPLVVKRLRRERARRRTQHTRELLGS